MDFSDDILIIARQDDGIAIRLRQALERRRHRVSHLDGPSAAHLFTIRVESNSTSVAPPVPIFVRASAWWYDQAPQDPDYGFLRAEEYATFWAATALSRAPVINRPGRYGAVGRMTSGAIASALNLQPELACSESYASGPEVVEGADDIWGEDANYVSAPIKDLQARIPVRARKVNPNALYEIITVVGTSAFAATDDSRTAELDLICQSLALARKANVHFATITWTIDDTGATPVRLNAEPVEPELRYTWNEVCQALCKDLMQ
jgi:hypothetical protein